MYKSTRAAEELRKFGLTLFCAMGFLGGLVLWRKGDTGFFFWGMGIMILLAGLIKPRLLGSIHKGWMGISFLTSFFVTHLILALMYYVFFTPMGLVIKALGKDLLRLKHDEDVKSYWIRRPRTEFVRERYEKMF